MRRFAFLCFLGVVAVNSFELNATGVVTISGKRTPEKQMVANFGNDLLTIIESGKSEQEQFNQLCVALKKYFDLRRISMSCLSIYYREMVKQHGEVAVLDIVSKILSKFLFNLFKKTGSDQEATCSITKSQKLTITQGGISSVKRIIFVAIKTKAKTYNVQFTVQDGKITDAKSENISMNTTVHAQLCNNKLTWKKLEEKAQFGGQK